MTALIDGYDAALFDLDGVVYLGLQAVPGAVSALGALRLRGVAVMYVTNNAARPAQVVVDQLLGLGIAADDASVLTSAQVAAAGLSRELTPGAKVLVCGSSNLSTLLAEAGFVIVKTADEAPAAVIQGYDPDLSWRALDEATLAIQAGAAWYATNTDASRPTDRGLVPGVGGAIAVIATALGGMPTVFGKPYRPMLDEAIRRTAARRPIFVGDRLDTDILGAVQAGIDSLMVFSGAHGKADLVSADPTCRPTHIGADVAALLAEPRTHLIGPDRVSCGGETVLIRGNEAVVATPPIGVERQFDALWAVANAAWAHPGLEVSGVLAELDLIH